MKTPGLWLASATLAMIAWIPREAADSSERRQSAVTATSRPRVIVTSDGEVDDECSLVRFLLYTNEWDVEGIITSSSQYHWRGHKWAGDDWVAPYLDAYAKVHPSLVQHDRRYPAPEFLRARTLLGNVKAEGEMDEVTPGSKRIAGVLLDESDERPVWIQAWGGTNTIARALKTIEEQHPREMPRVARKIRFFFIWEQDGTYQSYIRPRWGRYGILTVISDQFWAIAYEWDKILPREMQSFFSGAWMKQHILEGHGPLCALYKAKENGDFRSEGDSPAFLHLVDTGLRSLESPDWGGWGGRYVRVRDNTWLDPVPEPGYQYPEGRWFTGSAWGRRAMREGNQDPKLVAEYFAPIARWTDAVQNDFAVRADWCVKPYAEANHPPVAALAHAPDLMARAGESVTVSAAGSSDPDGDRLSYRWWHDRDAGSYQGAVHVRDAHQQAASFSVPGDAAAGQTIHLICEVTDSGTPRLTRYQRVIVSVAAERAPE
jgi:hypothetical protein